MSYTVSVVMATFNGEKYIKEQIQSIMNQTELPDEIIVIDDGSTDNTVDIIRDVLANTNTTYQLITHKKNKGVTEAFQEGIGLASSDYVMICDQDDVWKKEKIELTKSAMNENVALILCNASIVDGELNSRGKSMFEYIDIPIELKEECTTLSSIEMVNMSLKRNYVTGMCMAGRRDLMIKAFPIPKSMTYDAWLAMRLANEGSTVIINKELVYYRQHGNNVIGTNRKKESVKKYYSHRLNDLRDYVNKYEDLMRINYQYKECENKSKEAYQFYKDRMSLVSISLSQGVKCIICHWKNDKYRMYTGKPKNEIIKDLGMMIFGRHV